MIGQESRYVQATGQNGLNNNDRLELTDKTKTKSDWLKLTDWNYFIETDRLRVEMQTIGLSWLNESDIIKLTNQNQSTVADWLKWWPDTDWLKLSDWELSCGPLD